MKAVGKAGDHRPATAVIFGCAWRRVCLSVGFACTVFACSGLLAQTGAPGSDDGSARTEQESSRKVDESEESYRTRMELRDQRYREQKRADMIYAIPAGTSKLDQLPEASREHIKQQMRERTIASRQWKPGEDVSDYPYEPSEAAQTDAKLHNLEREAWAEQLEKYQQREAAAYANTQGGQSALAGGQESGKGGANGSSGASTASASQNQADAARKPDPYEGTGGETEEISTAGVSESALGFLQGKAGQTGTPEPAAETALGEGGDAGDHAAGESHASSGSARQEAPPGSLALSELALLQGMNNNTPGGASGPPLAQQSTPSEVPAPAADAGRDESGVEQTDVAKLSGTLIINDLKKLDNAIPDNSVIAGAGLGSGGAGIPASSQAAEPGTLDIAELKKLDGN